MAKKSGVRNAHSLISRRKRSQLPKREKTVGYYLKIYFGSLFVALIVFAVGSYITKPHPLCANSKTCISDESIKIDNNAVGIFEGHTVVPPKINLPLDSLTPPVLGTNVPAGEKHIYVDLSSQILYAYEGGAQIMQTFIASGKWGRTPVGNFHIWEKLRATRMAGGEGADAYDLPNVPFTMYFYHDFGLHGAYWHNNFGHPMSHGCVNMRIVDAEALYNWADGPTQGQLGTAVSICNQFATPNTCKQDNPIN